MKLKKSIAKFAAFSLLTIGARADIFNYHLTSASMDCSNEVGWENAQVRSGDFFAAVGGEGWCYSINQRVEDFSTFGHRWVGSGDFYGDEIGELWGIVRVDGPNPPLTVTKEGEIFEETISVVWLAYGGGQVGDSLFNFEGSGNGVGVFDFFSRNGEVRVSSVRYELFDGSIAEVARVISNPEPAQLWLVLTVLFVIGVAQLLQLKRK